MHAGNFGERYYLQDFGIPYRRDEYWVKFYARIADAIVAEIRPQGRVLDAGCAMGFLVEALRERGVEAYGFDISAYARTQTPESVQAYCWQASVTDEIADRYDLIICVEVLAHLPLADAERAVANLCRHADDVLFSVLPYGPAPLHFNLAPPEHWAGVFARHGFYRDFAFDATSVTPYAVRYRKDLYSSDTLIHNYEHWALKMRRELHDARSRVEFAEQTQQNMQRSWFWRARGLWQKAKGLASSRVSTEDDGTHS